MIALAPLSPDWHAAARDRLRARAQAAGLDGLLLTRGANLTYATGLFLTPNERPMAVWVPVTGDPVLFMPELERENAETAGIADLRLYDEFPGTTHPVLWMLGEIGRRKVGIDALEARLLERAQARLTRLDLRDHAMEARYLKTPEELALTRAAASYADAFLHRLRAAGADIITQGGTEQDLLADGMTHARNALFAAHGAAFAGTKMGITATVHSGPRAALPHGAVLRRAPQPGETLIAGIGASLGGYHAESGATFILGEPSPEQARIMAAMTACNDAAVDTARPGAHCEAVNTAALDALRDAGLSDTIRHRIGHGMGLEGHEAPWLAPGDATELTASMVFSNEPGVYRPEIDGYRAINTMIVTDSGGAEVPSRFQALVPPADRVIAL